MHKFSVGSLCLIQFDVWARRYDEKDDVYVIFEEGMMCILIKHLDDVKIVGFINGGLYTFREDHLKEFVAYDNHSKNAG